MAEKRILLVEDEAVTAMDLQSNLIRLGYDVPTFVASGEDAIRAAAEMSPDLILMDITLAGPLTGIEAAEIIRKAHAVPIVFLTAHSDAETLGRAKRAEPFGYLPKPCGLDTLVTTIEVALYKGEADALRRKAELRLRDVLGQQEIILNNIGVGVLHLRSRKILWVNRFLSTMYGYTPEEIIGRDTELFYADRASYEKIGSEGYAALARGEVYTGEVAMRRNDRSPVWCRLVGQAIEGDDEKHGSIWLLEDVTERRRLEEGLALSEEKYRIVADNTADWEFWVGPDQRFIYSSPSCENVTGFPAAVFERDPEEFRRMVHPDDRGAFDEHRHRANVEQGEGEMEFRIVLPDGTTRWIGHLCRPVTNEQGVFIGTRGSNRDITRRKVAEKERERLVAELQEALGKVKLLSGFIPICASCKKIRNDAGYWQQIEIYLHDHSGAEFSHGMCPDCGKKWYGELWPEGK